MQVRDTFVLKGKTLRAIWESVGNEGANCLRGFKL
jgi:hypothetical protein